MLKKMIIVSSSHVGVQKITEEKGKKKKNFEATLDKDDVNNTWINLTWFKIVCTRCPM